MKNGACRFRFRVRHIRQQGGYEYCIGSDPRDRGAHTDLNATAPQPYAYWLRDSL